jgi:hemin uptake protein HemP
MKSSSTPYHLTLSDGSRVDIEAPSCAVAVEEAIWLHRGRTVKRCYTGMTREDADEYNRRINSVTYKDPRDKPTPAMAGIIDFSAELPPHDPIHKDAVRPNPKRRVDSTELLFGDDGDKRIKIESRTARYREETGAGSSTFTP